MKRKRNVICEDDGGPGTEQRRCLNVSSGLAGSGAGRGFGDGVSQVGCVSKAREPEVRVTLPREMSQRPNETVKRRIS